MTQRSCRRSVLGVRTNQRTNGTGSRQSTRKTERFFWRELLSSARCPVGWLPKPMLPIATLPAVPGSHKKRSRLGNLFHVDFVFGRFLQTLFCTSLGPRDD